MTGWERLGTSRDAAELAWIRLVLMPAMRDHDEARVERTKATLRALAPVIQSGVARAFGAGKGGSKKDKKNKH